MSKILDCITFEELTPKKTGEAEASVVYYNELARYLNLRPGDKVLMIADPVYNEIRFERSLGQPHLKLLIAKNINKELRQRFPNHFRTRDDDKGVITTTFWPTGYPIDGEEAKSYSAVATCMEGDPCAHHMVGKAISSMRAYKAYCDETMTYFGFSEDLDLLCH